MSIKWPVTCILHQILPLCTAQPLQLHLPPVLLQLHAPLVNAVVSAPLDSFLPHDSKYGLQLAGEGPCLLTYLVTRYWQLFALRALTGISIGGCLPLVFNLLGDLFDAQHRANVLSGVLIATGAGTAIGQALAGLIGLCLNFACPASWCQSCTFMVHLSCDQIVHADVLIAIGAGMAIGQVLAGLIGVGPKIACPVF